MTTIYVLLKFIHVLIAILALGTSAGLGIVMEFYGEHPVHGAFVLRGVARIEWMFVLPGYLLMPVTGLWMAYGVWPLNTPWIAAALGLWTAGLALLLGSLGMLMRQIRLLETHGPATPAYQRASLLARALGALAGLTVVLTVYLMVAKPVLPWLGV